MAQQGVVLDQDQFCCSVCLHLLQDPVTLACGHSYCSSCIEGCWDKDEQKGVYSCPQCRQSFTPRPVLKRNNMLAEVVEKLKETGGAQAAPSELSSPAGPGGVTCDLCDGPRKQKALKSCLVCMVSYCQTHLQPHYQVPGLKKHKLMEATSGLQEMICSSHDKLLEIFCRTDQQCICYLCTMDQHKGHDTVSVKDEREKIQDKLVPSQQEVQQRVQQREKELKEVQQAVESFKSSGQAAVEDSERIFTELIRSIETRRSEVKDLIQAQQRAAVSQAEGLLERLEQEIAELRKREAELEKLCHAEDNIYFLKNYQSLSSTSVSPDVPSVTVPPLQYFKHVTEEVSELRDKLEELIQREFSDISSTVSTVDVFLPPKPKTRADLLKVPTVDVFLPPEPKTRADLLRYSCHLTLDPDTAHINLFLSAQNRKVTRLDQPQNIHIHPHNWAYANFGYSYPIHNPKRFTKNYQVLCREGLCGCCYWEVEWRGDRVSVAVAYDDIDRTDHSSFFGDSPKSWKLQCSSGGYSFKHNRVQKAVSGPRSSRIGVYLDHKAGTLSFYSVVSDTVSLLHRVQTTFTQPLYPGFWLSSLDNSAEIITLD